MPALALLSLLLQASQIAAPKWDTFPDTWVGVDALGRILPGQNAVGAPRRGKTLGMFYFLTFDRGGIGPFDNTKILAAHPEALNNIHGPAWGPLNSSHYWGEPLFGYYASDDDWVLRKHAQMLVNAGVDAVVFDNSNAVTYDTARRRLMDVWEDIRRHGGKTPQIAFLCPFGNPDSIGSRTLGELYDTVYGPGLYPDLWFRWAGKPVIMADASYANLEGLSALLKDPSRLPPGGSLGQVFHAVRPFHAVGGVFPTYATKGAGMMLSLYRASERGIPLARRQFTDVADNATVMLDVPGLLPAGDYLLEMTRPVGTIAWWTNLGGLSAGATTDRKPTAGARFLRIAYGSGGRPEELGSAPMDSKAAQARADKIRNFFTFRTPIAPYDVKHPEPGGWAWLQNYPQAAQLSPEGKVEQITVGVAQNYNSKTHLAPMSFPGAYGRSYHDGFLDPLPGAVRFGFNFAEQWKRALEVDPPYVFVTGWNEWTAGFYSDWAGYKAPPAVFVDEFSQEFSRDIEPMRGGHGDDYYYQLVAESRKYKGVRALPPVPLASIPLGDFSKWRTVQPEFRDSIGDTAPRNATGVGSAGPYVNQTGRNDIVAAKVAYDANNAYFYVRTNSPLTPRTDPDWMLLYINSDADYKTGWLGYDFVVNRRVGSQTASLDRNVKGRYQWQKVGDVRYKVRDNELQVTIPLALIGVKRRPSSIDFKWADHCYAKGDWTDFTLNGDAAPDDRFNYRAVLR